MLNPIARNSLIALFFLITLSEKVLATDSVEKGRELQALYSYNEIIELTSPLFLESNSGRGAYRVRMRSLDNLTPDLLSNPGYNRTGSLLFTPKKNLPLGDYRLTIMDRNVEVVSVLIGIREKEETDLTETNFRIPQGESMVFTPIPMTENDEKDTEVLLNGTISLKVSKLTSLSLNADLPIDTKLGNSTITIQKTLSNGTKIVLKKIGFVTHSSILPVSKVILSPNSTGEYKTEITIPKIPGLKKMPEFKAEITARKDERVARKVVTYKDNIPQQIMEYDPLSGVTKLRDTSDNSGFNINRDFEKDRLKFEMVFPDGSKEEFMNAPLSLADPDSKVDHKRIVKKIEDQKKVNGIDYSNNGGYLMTRITDCNGNIPEVSRVSPRVQVFQNELANPSEVTLEPMPGDPGLYVSSVPITVPRTDGVILDTALTKNITYQDVEKGVEAVCNTVSVKGIWNSLKAAKNSFKLGKNAIQYTLKKRVLTKFQADLLAGKPLTKEIIKGVDKLRDQIQSHSDDIMSYFDDLSTNAIDLFFLPIESYQQKLEKETTNGAADFVTKFRKMAGLDDEYQQWAMDNYLSCTGNTVASQARQAACWKGVATKMWGAGADEIIMGVLTNDVTGIVCAPIKQIFKEDTFSNIVKDFNRIFLNENGYPTSFKIKPSLVVDGEKLEVAGDFSREYKLPIVNQDDINSLRGLRFSFNDIPNMCLDIGLESNVKPVPKDAAGLYLPSQLYAYSGVSSASWYGFGVALNPIYNYSASIGAFRGSDRFSVETVNGQEFDGYVEVRGMVSGKREILAQAPVKLISDGSTSAIKCQIIRSNYSSTPGVQCNEKLGIVIEQKWDKNTDGLSAACRFPYGVDRCGGVIPQGNLVQIQNGNRNFIFLNSAEAYGSRFNFLWNAMLKRELYNTSFTGGVASSITIKKNGVETQYIPGSTIYQNGQPISPLNEASLDLSYKNTIRDPIDTNTGARWVRVLVEVNDYCKKHAKNQKLSGSFYNEMSILNYTAPADGFEVPACRAYKAASDDLLEARVSVPLMTEAFRRKLAVQLN